MPHLEARVQAGDQGQEDLDTAGVGRRDKSPEVPSIEDAYAATRRQIEEELQRARALAELEEPAVHLARRQDSVQPPPPLADDHRVNHLQGQDQLPPPLIEDHDVPPRAQAGAHDVQHPAQADVRRRAQPGDRDHHHADRVPDAMPPLRRPAAQLHRDLALRGQRGRQSERREPGQHPQQPQFRVPGPVHRDQHTHHPHNPNPRGRGRRGRSRRSRSRSSLGRVQREIEAVARQRRMVQQELAQTRAELELIDLRRQVLRSDRERGVRELMGRGQPLRPVTATTIPGNSARQILDLTPPDQQQRELEMDAGAQARLMRLARRQQRERARLEQEEILRRALRQYPWSRPFGSPIGPAQYMGMARRQALLDLARTAERIAEHPGLANAWG